VRTSRSTSEVRQESAGTLSPDQRDRNARQRQGIGIDQIARSNSGRTRAPNARNVHEHRSRGRFLEVEGLEQVYRNGKGAEKERRNEGSPLRAAQAPGSCEAECPGHQREGAARVDHVGGNQTPERDEALGRVREERRTQVDHTLCGHGEGKDRALPASGWPCLRRRTGNRRSLKLVPLPGITAPGRNGLELVERKESMSNPAPAAPSKEEAIERAVSLMTGFAERTGLTSDGPRQRYLWTDAFAVCNFLGLARLTSESRFLDLALRLVDQVHHVLGRYREDDPRTGWISGLPDEEGESHPTRGGLRIGKKLPERRSGEQLDEVLEWDRDGQYFHYLTQWMHALDQVSSSTKDPQFNLWARELGEVAHSSFTRGSDGRSRADGRRMVWKMSTDLSRPLVSSMGHHDPLDGYITYVQLETTASLLQGGIAAPSLKRAIADFAAMLQRIDVRTSDPLGLGGLLSDAWRVAQLMTRGGFEGGKLPETLLAAAQEGLSSYTRQGEWLLPPSRRLAFRELGLVIGLFAIEQLREEMGRGRHHVFADHELQARTEILAEHSPLSAAIVSFWVAPDHQAISHAWSEHRDINEVMLATSLCPEGFLTILPGR
jgi:hypothetical protein